MISILDINIWTPPEHNNYTAADVCMPGVIHKSLLK